MRDEQDIRAVYGSALSGTAGSDRRRQDVTRVPGRTGVCVVAKGYTYQCTGYMVRVLQMARTLHRLGLNVYIVWLLPVKQFLHSWRLGRAHLAPFDMHFVPILPCFGVRAIERLHNWLVGKWIDLLCRRHGAEIVQIEGTEAMQFVAPASLPRVLDVHGDMVAEKHPDMPREADLRATAHLRQEQGAIRAADRILCISRAMRDVLRARHGGIPPAYIVPCLVEVHKFSPAFETRESRRAEFGLSDRLVLCYTGSLFRWQCVEETLRLIIKLRRIDTRYFALFITPGDLSPYARLLQQIGRQEDDFRILSLSSDRVPAVLCMADAGLLLRAESPTNRVCSPTKLGEYLAAGAPVVTTEYAGDAPSIVRETHTGAVLTCAAPADREVTRLHEFLLDVWAHRQQWFQRTCHAARTHRSWEANEETLAACYESILGSRLSAGTPRQAVERI